LVGVQKFRSSDVDCPVSLTNEINDKEKKREAINPEPGIRNLFTQTDPCPIDGRFRGLQRSTVTFI
jgi:hypothetical protein